MALDQPIYTDGLDVSMKIGGDEWRVVEARAELTRYMSPDFVDFKAVPGPETTLPADPPAPKDEGGLLGEVFTLDVDNRISSERQAGNEETRLFTGNLANLSTAAEASWEGVAYVPSHQAFAQGSGSFYNTHLNLSDAKAATEYNPRIPAKYYEQYDTEKLNKASAYGIKVADLISLIVSEIGVQFSLELKPFGYDVGGEKLGRDNFIKFSAQNIKASSALQKAKLASNSELWFDRYGIMWFGAPLPNEHVFKHDLQFITDTDAGLQTPPYQSVRVIGSGVASEEGWDSTNVNNSQKRVIEANVDPSGEGGEELQQPTFVYRNLELTTYEQVRAAATKILKKLREQQAGGKVTVVGMPEVRPMDGIVLPDEGNQPMGGETYGVSKVIHKLNGSDGFKTEIGVGFPTSVQRGVMASEIDSSPENYVYAGGEGGSSRDTTILRE